MFNPAEALRDNPALFACYILFVYFRGRNACRIEREMRSLGFTTFHRRNLYPRGRQPGWIARWRWNDLFTAETQRGRETLKQDAQDRQDAGPTTKDEYPVHPVHPVRNTPPRLSASAVEKPDFSTWLKRVSPNMTWDWRHQQVIIEQLQKVTDNQCKRLMIFLPPRHGKSELVSVRYTAWRMQQDPKINVILGSYNQRLADRMSRKIRTVICDSERMRIAESGMRNGVDADASRFPSSDQKVKRESGTTNQHEPTRNDMNTEIPHSAFRNPQSPFPFSRPRPKNAVSEWETAAGGSFRAVGSGSGVTGFGANLIVIDDPVKNRAQAESETFRNRVWDWYKDDLYTRLEPDGSIVLIQTRWHEDDLAGRLLRENLDDWTIINLPALSERNADAIVRERPRQDEQDKQDAEGGNPTGREGAPELNVAQTELQQDVQDKQDVRPPDRRDEHRAHPVHPVESPAKVSNPFEWRDAPDVALCPERFPIEALAKLKAQLGTYAFSALYQQRPTPAGGQIFKREWFKNIIDFAPPGLKWKRGYDLAVSTRTDGDYTASFRCAFDKQGNLYISGGFRRRIEFPEQRRYIIDRMLNERDTEHGVELALHGQALIQDLRRDPSIRGKSLRGVKVSTDKLTRALTWSPLAEEGKVVLVRSAECGTRDEMHKPAREQGRYRDSTVGGRNASVKGRDDDPCNTEIAPRPSNREKNVIKAAADIPHSAFRTPHSPWIEDLLDELTAFPNGTHDDQIDAISLAVQMAAKREFISRGFLIT